MEISETPIVTRARKAVLVTFLLMASLTGCAVPGKVRIVQPGGVADIRFLCRQQNGDVVAATDKAVGMQTGFRKSAVFLSRDKAGPISVTAGPLQEPKLYIERSFEDEIVAHLAGAVVGMKEGESRTVRLAAKDVPDRERKDYVIKVARVRERAKEIHMPTAEYVSRAGKPPQVGETFTIDPAVPGRVETVTADEVVIRFYAKPAEVVSTPFGPGHIRESEDAYEIEIDAKKGDLIRTANLVGRVSAVDEDYIEIDYRHPLGGETLDCDVAVEKIAEIRPMKNSGGE